MGKSKTAAQWHDAPTCEGLWWFSAGNGGEVEIVKICRPANRPLLARFVGTNDEMIPSTLKGRWFGPLVPPPDAHVPDEEETKSQEPPTLRQEENLPRYKLPVPAQTVSQLLSQPVRNSQALGALFF